MKKYILNNNNLDNSNNISQHKKDKDEVNELVKEKQREKNNEREKDKSKDSKKKYENKEIIYDDINNSYKKASTFLDKCLKNILIQDINEIKKNYSDNPKISVIVPVYNSEKLVYRCIKSIQNQDIISFEIILINDFSTDGTLNYLESLQKEDPRIKIINNKKNMGTLYSRSIGVLSSKGKYIFSIDNDDMFLDKDIFSIISNVAEKDNFDIIEFKGIQTSQNKNNEISKKFGDTNWSNHKLNLILYQPELGDYPLRSGGKIGQYRLFDVYLWTKCISTDIYKNAINKMGKERYSRYMLAHEDVVGIFIIFNTAKSYKFIGKYGIFRISRGGSAFGKTKPLEYELKDIYLLDVVIEFSHNTDIHRKLIPNILIRILGLKQLPNIVKIKYNKKLLYSILDKILKSDNYTETSKNEIRKRGKMLKFLDYTF